MFNANKKLCVFGTGGAAKDSFVCLLDQLKFNNINFEDRIVFVENDTYFKENIFLDRPVMKQSEFNPDQHQAFVAVGSPQLRQKIVESLPGETEFFSIRHPSSVLSQRVSLGVGSLISAGAILTCDITLGAHTHLNVNSTLSHDCVAKDYLTLAPGVNISGSCRIGLRVEFGTNSCVKQGVHIVDDVMVGMGAVVVKNLDAAGVYIGCPARLQA